MPGVALCSALGAFKMAQLVKWPLVTRLLGEPQLADSCRRVLLFAFTRPRSEGLHIRIRAQVRQPR